jgi:hypothetical protein
MSADICHHPLCGKCYILRSIYNTYPLVDQKYMHLFATLAFATCILSYIAYDYSREELRSSRIKFVYELVAAFQLTLVCVFIVFHTSIIKTCMYVFDTYR